jgi:hypothetical protein
MLTSRVLGLALSFLTIATVMISAGSFVPIGHAVTNQTVQPIHQWTDALSGGVWARLNHLTTNGSILDSAQAQAMIGSVASSPAPAQDPPSPFTNNFRVTGNSSLFPFEDEPSIAVRNQTSQFLMVVGANSLSTGQMVSYVSTDQGTDWSAPSFLSLSKGNDTFASDPALGVDRGGTFYYSFLSLAASSSGTVTSDDVVVATSADGVHWTNHVAVQRKTFTSPSTITSEFYDKEYLAVGPNQNNLSFDTLYVTYTDFTEYCPFLSSCNVNTTVMQVHSTNAGVTWSSPVAVSPTATFPAISMTGRIITGSMPAVASNGNLYVAYFDTGPNGFLNTTASIMIAKSTNGGTSFSTPVTAAPIPQQLTFASEGNSCCFRWWSSMFPSIDVAPDGTVYIAYGARQAKYSQDPADVFLVASTDGGSTWSLPTMINDNTSQNGHFFAWLKADSNNVVHIIWGDQRLDPVGLGYDIFYATATNQGRAISQNIRVTDVGTDPLFTIGFVGDYFNMAVSGNQTYPVWTDGRRAVRPLGREILMGETDIFTARLGPRDTPSLAIENIGNAGYQQPVTITATGLPREAYFVARISGLPVISQTHLISFFFSTKSGTLTDIVLPTSNYYGAYTVALDDWLSGAPVSTASLYIVDSRSLQVSITGPTTGSPGDNVIWTIQLISPTGPAQSLGATYTINQALLTTPGGSIQDLTSNARSTGTSSYSVSFTLPSSAAGSYTLYVNASETGALVASSGTGTATVTINSQVQNVANLASSEQIYTIIVGVIAATGVALQVIQMVRRRPRTPEAIPPTNPPATPPPTQSPA